MTIKGKLCADAFVHAGSDFLLVDTEPELRETLAARLERYIIADDVQIEDVTDDVALLHLIDFAADAGCTPNSPNCARRWPRSARAFGPSNRNAYGRPGTDVFFEPSHDAQKSTVACTRVSRNSTPTPPKLGGSSPGCRAGGRNWTKTRCPPKPASKNAPSATRKGCYIGQEIVSRVKSVGHVNRQLRGLRALDSSPLYEGMILRPARSERRTGLLTANRRSGGSPARPRRPDTAARISSRSGTSGAVGKHPAPCWMPCRSPGLPTREPTASAEDDAEVTTPALPRGSLCPAICMKTTILSSTLTGSPPSVALLAGHR